MRRFINENINIVIEFLCEEGWLVFEKVYYVIVYVNRKSSYENNMKCLNKWIYLYDNVYGGI